MAFVSNESERNQLWVRSFDPASGTPTKEGKWQVSVDGAEAVMDWRADGQELYYIHNDVDISRDGRQFVVTLPIAPGSR